MMTNEKPERLSSDEISEILNKASKGSSGGDMASKYKELGDVFEDAKYEGKNIYATVKFPGGGVFEGDEQHDVALIREMSGRSDMLLMNFDDFDSDALKQVVLDCVESIGPFTDKVKIASMIFKDLLIGDYLYLIIRIRQLSVGDIHNFSGECRKCKATTKCQASLSDLEYECSEVMTLDSHERHNTFAKGPAEWEFYWHLMTEGDSSYLDKASKFMSKTTGNKASNKRDSSSSKGKEIPVDLLTAQMLGRVDRVIEPGFTASDGTEVEPKEIILGRNTKVTADGHKTMQQSIEYLRSLPMWLRIKFSAMVNKVEPGIDPEVVWDCSDCGFENTQIVYPLSPNFFLQLDTEAA